MVKTTWLAPLLVACAHSAHSAPPPAGPGVNDGCHSAAFTVRVPAPAAAGRARLRIRRSGEGMAAAEKRTCVRVGDAAPIVLEKGVERTVEIAADARALQRLWIGGELVLFAVRPGTELVLVDHPCFFWDLYDDQSDPWGATPVRCTAREDEDCPAGWAHAPHPAPAVDPICGEDPDGGVRRCVPVAHVRAAGVARPAHAIPAPVEPVPFTTLTAGATLEIAPGGCGPGLARVMTDRETALLAIPAGGRWTLALDAEGHLSGVMETPGPTP